MAATVDMEKLHGSPEFRETHDVFMSIMCMLLCIVYVVTFGRDVFAAAVAWWRSSQRSSDADGKKLQLKIAAEVTNNRLENFNRAAQAHNLVASLVAAGVFLNVILRYPRYMTPIQDYALVLFTVCTLIITNRPILSTSRSLGFWYSTLMFIACVAVASGGKDQTQYLSIESFLIPPRFMFSVAYGGHGLACLWNFCYSVAFLVGYGSTWSDDFVMLVQTMWQREALIISAVMFAVSVVNDFLTTKVRREIEAKIQNSESSAMTELLGLVCDVVVELDADLRIACPAPKFAAFATLNATKDMRGLRFQHFMPVAADSERFESCLRACQGEEGRTQPGAVHIALRDSLGNNMQVEVFFVHYLDIDRCSHYFVGVREFTDLAWPTDLNHGPIRRTQSRSRGHGGGHSSGGATARPSDAHALGSIDPQQGSEAADRDHDDESVSSSLTSTANTTSGRLRFRLRVPHARPTMEPAKDMMLTDLVLQWNYRARMTTCCPWHTAIMELKRSLRRLEARACSQQFGGEFAKEVVQQCEGCGVVALPEHLYLAERPSRCPACSGKWVACANIVCL